jgi:hypothetical protein
VTTSRTASLALLLLLGACGSGGGGATIDAAVIIEGDPIDATPGARDDGGPDDVTDGGADPIDAAPDDPDAAPIDAGEPDARPFEIREYVIEDSASVGTRDSYQFPVTPGDPFEAWVTGGGGGTWGLYLSNGTSQGVYCSDTPHCQATIPSGVHLVLLTVTTTDIGYYQAIVHLAVHDD